MGATLVEAVVAVAAAAAAPLGSMPSTSRRSVWSSGCWSGSGKAWARYETCREVSIVNSHDCFIVRRNGGRLMILGISEEDQILGSDALREKERIEKESEG